MYAFVGVYSHICEQIELSGEVKDRYRRREMIRLQIAREKIENLLKEGKEEGTRMGFEE